MNNSQNKFLESTNKKKTRATSANGKELQKKDHYFEEKIK